VIVEEVQSELGAAAEIRQVVLQIEAVLPRIGWLAVCGARNLLEVGDVGAAQGAEVNAQVGELAEVEHDLAPSGSSRIIGAEIGAIRLGLGLVPLEQVQELAAQMLGELHVEQGHLVGQQRLLQL